MDFLKECANDDEILLSFDEMTEMVRADGGVPMVPSRTYASYSPSQVLRFRVHGGLYDPDDRPVIMRGAWFLLAGKYQSNGVFIDEVKERYTRFYKITALNERQSEIEADKLHRLMKKKPSKRWIYWSSNSSYNGVDDNYFFSDSYSGKTKTITVLGERYEDIERSKFIVIKSIYRHIKKLGALINTTNGREKWQQLIQQAI